MDPTPTHQAPRSPAAVLLAAVAAVSVLATGAPSVANNLPQVWLQSPSLPAGYTPRWDAAAAPFPPAGQVVLFGGAPADIGQSWYNDTWLYSPATGKWSSGPSAPPALSPRGGMAMAYHPGLRKVVMFGGSGPTWPPSSRTWLFNGTKWTQGPLAPAEMGGRVGAGMVYADNIGKIVLVAGSGTKAYKDTWLFDGSAWSPGPKPPAALGPRAFFGMAYDPILSKVVVAGGDGGSGVWYFDGRTWTTGPSLPAGLTRRERLRLAFDPQLGGDVLFGGLGPDAPASQLWLLKDGAWSQLGMHPNPKPVGRLDPNLVWEPVSQQFLAFGGERTKNNGKVAMADSWRVLSPPVTLAPAVGRKGAAVSATSGPGWPTGTKVTVSWDKTPLKTVTADAQGMVKASFRVPSGAKAGSHDVKLTNDGMGLVRTATFAVSSGSATVASPAAPAASPATETLTAAPTPGLAYARPSGPATGKITAHDGRFWLGSSPVLLRGVNASPIEHTYLTSADYARMAGWGFNVIRMRLHWQDLEPTPPTLSGTTWTHHWDSRDLRALQQQITWASQNGLYVLVENSLPMAWPDWLFTAAYNTHKEDYSTSQALMADYWTDSLMQQFTKEYLTYMVSQISSLPGILGYEPLDEPNAGTLPIDQPLAAAILAVQLSYAQAIRAKDPGRVIFFTTHHSLGADLPNVNLTPWTNLGNVAFDVHDYFGGRWGTCLDLNPSSPSFGQVAGLLLGFTIDPNTPPYLGTTVVQRRFLQGYLGYLLPKGIPLFIGEFGGKDEAEPNMKTVMGSMTSALNSLGVSWAAWTYESLLTAEGAEEPWVQILASAAKA